MCVESYIKQIVKNPLYSQFYTMELIPFSAGGLGIDIDYSNQGAQLILIHSVILQNSGIAIDHKLIDKFDRVLMSITGNVNNLNGQYAFDYIINSGRIYLNMTNTAVRGIMKVTVLYQFIYSAEEKLLNRFPDGNTRP